MTSTAVRQQPSEVMGKTHRECPLCESHSLEYEFVVEKSPVCGCQGCGLLFLNPQPGIAAHDIDLALNSQKLNEIYEANAAKRIEQLITYAGIETGKLLLVGTDVHAAAEAERRGFTCLSLTAQELESTPDSELPRQVDACLLFCALERMKDPLSSLRTIRKLLRGAAALMVVAPTTDSKTARIFGGSWWEFRRTNLFYFSIDTLQSLLVKAGFGDPIISPDQSLVSLNYLRQTLRRRPQALKRYRFFRAAVSVTPFLRNTPFRLLHGRTMFLVRAKPEPITSRLSVIVPAYNEKSTFGELMSQLLAKTIDGVDIEVIVVESNSKDGTREVALQYSHHPRVKLILEEKPSGKGHAVRAGLNVATGDYVVIQDADLEYDINDYDALLGPLIRFQQNFVLGSRHVVGKNSWKIRDFGDSGALSAYFNFGHLFFLTLFNFIYRQQLTDPFTMFKVFRRECIFGLSFECNRFDFDNELIIKLLRKGYKVIEMPVNYKSRSIKEGKKVTFVWDPLTWVWSYLKYRVSPLYGDDRRLNGK